MDLLYVFLLLLGFLDRIQSQSLEKRCGSPPSPSTTTVAPTSSGAAVSLASAIVQISSDTASCAGVNSQYASQCATAGQAAPAILSSFGTYNVTTVNEKAAMISLMMYESVDFRYNENVFPGRPGQGCRNMQMANFNLKYAQSIPALANNLSAIVGTMNDTSCMTNQTLNSMRGLLISDPAYDFGAASWFLRTQCPSNVQDSLKTGKQAEWESYLSTCVGVQASEGNRTAYYTAAVQALGGY